MLLVLIVFLGGVLTILSPCILPVLPFVFTRSDRSFLANGLPMLAGMSLTFAAVGGTWAGGAGAGGNGVVREQRLYQLIRQSGPVGEHTFSIEFLDPGVQAYSFTFG